MTDLLTKLQEYDHSDYYPFHMPGHKRNMKNHVLEEAYHIDITEIEGFDNLHQPEGILLDAQIEAASVFGSRKAFYLINGSTSGILTAIFSVTRPHQKILISRNCHKSVYHALCLRELQPVYLVPEVMDKWNIAKAITPEQINQMLKEDADISAVVITSPTFEGIVADIREIARVVHKFDIPLIVDEAHGAHFSFHPRFPKSAICCGADLIIQSLHKTLPSFTQTALLHINSNRIDDSKVSEYLSYFQTSSPSYLLMSGIQWCIQLLAEKKSELWNDFFLHFDGFMLQMERLTKLQLLTAKVLIDDMQQNKGEERKNTDFLDPGKLVISSKNTNMSGKQLYQCLLDHYHLQMEMVAEDYVLAILTMNDTKEGFQRLASALLEIDLKLSLNENSVSNTIKTIKIPPSAMHLYDAINKEHCTIRFLDAEGKVTAVSVNLYPPGIPLIVPGEIITKEFIICVQEYISLGLPVQGLSTDLEYINIVKE